MLFRSGLLGESHHPGCRGVIAGVKMPLKSILCTNLSSGVGRPSPINSNSSLKVNLVPVCLAAFSIISSAFNTIFLIDV